MKTNHYYANRHKTEPMGIQLEIVYRGRKKKLPRKGEGRENLVEPPLSGRSTQPIRPTAVPRHFKRESATTREETLYEFREFFFSRGERA